MFLKLKPVRVFNDEGMESSPLIRWGRGEYNIQMGRLGQFGAQLEGTSSILPIIGNPDYGGKQSTQSKKKLNDGLIFFQYRKIAREGDNNSDEANYSSPYLRKT